jgi:gamma-glutamylaminecyclotransferase
LVIASRYNIPYLLDVPNTGHHIRGEVYSIDEAKLKHLDVLECYPKYYTRRLESIRVEARDGEEPLKCWIYFLIRHSSKLLELPMLSDYRSEGDHGLKYHEGYCDHVGASDHQLSSDVFFRENTSDPEDIDEISEGLVRNVAS